MTIDITEGFEGGSDGVQISTSNTTFGGIAGTGTILTFSNTHAVAGSLSMKVNANANFASGRAIYTVRNVVYARAYIYFESLPPAFTVLLQVFTSGTNRAKIQTTSSNQLDLRNGTTNVYTGTTTMTTGVWYRIEWLVDATVGANKQQVRLYNLHDTTALEDSGARTYTSGNTHDRVAFGPTTTGTWVGYYDDVQTRDDTWPGPSAINASTSGVTATASGLANPGVATGESNGGANTAGVTATSTASANAGSYQVGWTVTGVTATGSSVADPGTAQADATLSGAKGSATGQAYAGTLSASAVIIEAGSTGLGNAQANPGSASSAQNVNTQGSTATGSAQAYAGSADATKNPTVSGVTATASAQGHAGSISISRAVDGATAEASAAVLNLGSTQDQTATATAQADPGEIIADQIIDGATSTGSSSAPEGEVHADAVTDGETATGFTVVVGGEIKNDVAVDGSTATATAQAHFVAIPTDYLYTAVLGDRRWAGDLTSYQGGNRWKGALL